MASFCDPPAISIPVILPFRCPPLDFVVWDEDDDEANCDVEAETPAICAAEITLLWWEDFLFESLFFEFKLDDDKSSDDNFLWWSLGFGDKLPDDIFFMMNKIKMIKMEIKMIKMKRVKKEKID